MAAGAWLPHASSVAAFVGQLGGYVALSSALQSAYYIRRAGQEAAWKVQPDRRAGSGERAQWWLPALALLPGTGSRPAGRHPRHALYCTLNLLASAAFAALVVEGYCRGWNNLRPSVGAPALLGVEGWPLAKASCAQTLVEYYWHRLMHWPPCYKALHKLHHYYKSPKPFDDLFIHPLEACGYYTILYLLPTCCLGAMPVADFAAYIALHGLLGVLDHSGITLSLQPLYAVADHDAHHQLFHFNYGFPTTLMDALHGTRHSPGRRSTAMKG
eukprot:jgi/Tetstr1/446991/TSEL_034449.t1